MNISLHFMVSELLSNNLLVGWTSNMFGFRTANIMTLCRRPSRYYHPTSKSTKPCTRGVQKVLQLDYKEAWKCYKLHFIFQYNLF